MRASITIHSNSVEATFALGAAIANAADRPLLIQLSGQLGGGKTHLTKGLVAALGASDAINVTSPTFTLLQQYGENPRVYHIDLYRIDTPEAAPDEILDALEDDSAWVCVEWADRHPSLYPERPSLEIDVSHTGEEARAFSLRGDSSLMEAIALNAKRAEGDEH